jgi:hypothetical protein
MKDSTDEQLRCSRLAQKGTDLCDAVILLECCQLCRSATQEAGPRLNKTVAKLVNQINSVPKPVGRVKFEERLPIRPNRMVC